MKRIFHDIDQVEAREAWMDLRISKITSSSFSTVMANLGKTISDNGKKYALRLALERATHIKVEDRFVSKDIEEGIEFEPIARSQYEIDNLVEVKNGGFMEYGNLGSSSDGLVGEYGMIEVKCVKYNTHMERWLNGSYDLKYKWQLQSQLYIYDRQWVDFVSFNNIYPIKKNLYCFRVKRDESMIEQIKTQVIKFEEQISIYQEALK